MGKDINLRAVKWGRNEAPGYRTLNSTCHRSVPSASSTSSGLIFSTAILSTEPPSLTRRLLITTNRAAASGANTIAYRSIRGSVRNVFSVSAGAAGGGPVAAADIVGRGCGAAGAATGTGGGAVACRCVCAGGEDVATMGSGVDTVAGGGWLTGRAGGDAAGGVIRATVDGGTFFADGGGEAAGTGTGVAGRACCAVATAGADASPLFDDGGAGLTGNADRVASGDRACQATKPETPTTTTIPSGTHQRKPCRSGCAGSGDQGESTPRSGVD